jgi:hypothetical protein
LFSRSRDVREQRGLLLEFTLSRFTLSRFTAPVLQLRTLINTDLRRLQEALHEAGAPWTPGLLPDWKER